MSFGPSAGAATCASHALPNVGAFVSPTEHIRREEQCQQCTLKLEFPTGRTINSGRIHSVPEESRTGKCVAMAAALKMRDIIQGISHSLGSGGCAAAYLSGHFEGEDREYWGILCGDFAFHGTCIMLRLRYLLPNYYLKHVM